MAGDAPWLSVGLPWRSLPLTIYFFSVDVKYRTQYFTYGLPATAKTFGDVFSRPY